MNGWIKGGFIDELFIKVFLWLYLIFCNKFTVMLIMIDVGFLGVRNI